MVEIPLDLSVSMDIFQISLFTHQLMFVFRSGAGVPGESHRRSGSVARQSGEH